VKPLRLAAALTAYLALCAASSAVELDPALPAYKPVSGVSGQIKAVGSDTLGVLMRTWADKFKALYPEVKIDIESKGSATAPPALTEGAAQVGPMSRPMSVEEVDAFQKKYGYYPVSTPVAVDEIAVFVNKDNPIQCLTIPQLDQIFSKSHLYSGGINVDKWGAVGLTGDWADKPIALFGRNAQSGTHEIFVADVLAHGDFKDNLKEEAGSEGVVAAVASDKNAIGYAGIGYLTDGVRAVSLAATAASKCADASFESALSGKYPLERFLYVYLNKDPKKPLEPAVHEFIKYILSKDGQAETIKAGVYPLINSTRAAGLKHLGVAETQ
jgi:phosphate transport system substrate-binding protein